MTGRNQRGFTLTELMIAMAFVAFLLIFVVTAIVQTMRIYNKGVAIRHINQSGRQLSEELTRSLRYANAADFAANAYHPTEQRLCANGVSYVWNLEATAGLDEKNRYSGADVSNPPIRLVRVDDKAGLLCSNPTSPVTKSQARDLLDARLTLQRFDVSIREAGRIAVVSFVVSTQGDNRPLGPGRLTPSGFECPAGGDGAFCAFGDFQSTVYIRN